MIPSLPVHAVREALDAGAWDQASSLLAEHGRAVRDAMATQPPDAGSRARWLALLQAQRALMAQLQGARDDAGAMLQRLRQGQRGAAAYRDSLR